MTGTVGRASDCDECTVTAGALECTVHALRPLEELESTTMLVLVILSRCLCELRLITCRTSRVDVVGTQLLRQDTVDAKCGREDHSCQTSRSRPTKSMLPSGAMRGAFAKRRRGESGGMGGRLPTAGRTVLFSSKLGPRASQHSLPAARVVLSTRSCDTYRSVGYPVSEEGHTRSERAR